MFDNKNYTFLKYRWKNICKGNSKECVIGHLLFLEWKPKTLSTAMRAYCVICFCTVPPADSMDIALIN